MKQFSYSATLEFTNFTYSQMSIPVDRQDELQSIIGHVDTFEEHAITLKVGKEYLDAHFRRYEQGQLKLHFGRGFKEAFRGLSDLCLGIRLDHLDGDCFELSAIDNLNDLPL